MIGKDESSNRVKLTLLISLAAASLLGCAQQELEPIKARSSTSQSASASNGSSRGGAGGSGGQAPGRSVQPGGEMDGAQGLDTSLPALTLNEMSGSWGSPCGDPDPSIGLPAGTFVDQVITIQGNTLTDEGRAWTDNACTTRLTDPTNNNTPVGYSEPSTIQIVGGVDDQKTTLIISTGAQGDTEVFMRVVGTSIYSAFVENKDYQDALTTLESNISGNFGLTRVAAP